MTRRCPFCALTAPMKQRSWGKSEPCSLTQGRRLLPSPPQSVSHPGRCFSQANPFLLQGGSKNGALVFTCMHYPLLHSQGMIFFPTQFCPQSRETTGLQHQQYLHSSPHPGRQCNTALPMSTGISH